MHLQNDVYLHKTKIRQILISVLSAVYEQVLVLMLYFPNSLKKDTQVSQVWAVSGPVVSPKISLPDGKHTCVVITPTL